jgi:hypothetical protein
MLMFRKTMPFLSFCLALATSITLPAVAQTRPAAFDSASLVRSLSDADAPQGAVLLDKVKPDQVPAFIAAFDPNNLRADAHDAIMQCVADLVRRARAARLVAYQAAEKEWDLRTGLAVYKASGHRDSAWDALAIDALSSNASATRAEGAKKYHTAIEAGCTDPLVRYYDIRRALLVKAIAPAAGLAQYVALLPDLDKSAYSPVRKFQIRIQMLNLCMKDLPNNLLLAQQSWKEAVKLLPEIGSEKPGHLLLTDAFDALDSSGPKLGHSIKADFDKIFPHMIALFPNDPYPYAYAAKFYTSWAWEARGSGWANSVTEDGWRLFGNRLAQAEQAATTGATLDPLNGPCPAAMITICMGRSYDRSVMEKWFTRAMLANPDNDFACRAKYTYLLPKWGGSVPDVIEFGRECLNTGTVESRIPVILVDVHCQLAEDSGDEDVYFSQPDVWTDINAVYKKLLHNAQRKTSDHENWLFDQAKYIEYAYKCHQWQAVLDLMDQFKDDIDFNVFGGKAIYNFYKKRAAQQLAKSPI